MTSLEMILSSFCIYNAVISFCELGILHNMVIAYVYSCNNICALITYRYDLPYYTTICFNIPVYMIEIAPFYNYFIGEIPTLMEIMRCY